MAQVPQFPALHPESITIPCSSAKASKFPVAGFQLHFFPDLEKLIRDIKISPNVSDEDAIKKIDSCLKELSHNAQVCNEVQGMKMLLATIEKKIKKPSVRKENAATQSSSKKNSLQATAIKINEISPIKQIPDEANSRILYTNFSLRGIEKSIVSEKDSTSFQSSEKKNPIKVTISKFDEDQTSEADKLN